MLRFGVVIALGVGCGRIDFDARALADGAVVDGSIEDAAPLDSNPGSGLVSRGLVARYFVAEAGAGSPEVSLADATADPFELPVTYDTGQPVFVDVVTGRGLRFDTIELDGGACRELTATDKIVTALAGSPTGTLEVVTSVVAGSMSGSRFVHIGEAADWGFSFGVDTVTSPGNTLVNIGFVSDATQAQTLDGIWLVPLERNTRLVLQYVFDGTQLLDTDRYRLYMNGERVGSDAMLLVPSVTTLSVHAGESLCLGNRAIGDRSLHGAIGYGAIYSTALTDVELALNAARLLASDDP